MRLKYEQPEQVKEMEWLSGPKEKLVLAHGEFIISEKVVALYYTSLPRRRE